MERWRDLKEWMSGCDADSSESGRVGHRVEYAMVCHIYLF